MTRNEKLLLLSLFSEYNKLVGQLHSLLQTDESAQSEVIFKKSSEILSALTNCDFDKDIYSSDLWFEHDLFIDINGRKKSHVGDGLRSVLYSNLSDPDKLDGINSVVSKFNELKAKES